MSEEEEEKESSSFVPADPSPSARDTEQTWKLRGNPVSDQSTATDKLGFRPYVDAVAAFLLHEDTTPPLTMSVEGGWGTGKSSFMRQLKAELEKSPAQYARGPTVAQDALPRKTTPPMTFWFNAWRHDKQDAMWATFALSITKQMRDSQSFVGRLRGDLKLVASRIATEAGWMHVASVSFFWLIFGGGAVAVIAFLATADHDTRASVITKFSAAKQSAFGLFQEAILPMFAQITATHYWLAVVLFVVFYGIWFRKGFGKRLEWKLAEYLDKPEYKSRIAFIESFHRDFKKVIAAYARDRRIFIFVDDLDRCDVPRAAELMQAINLMIGDDDHLIFILGMDREKIAAGITLRYKDLIPFLDIAKAEAPSARHPSTFGYSYLEKFIQITFRVPRPSESGLEEFLQSLGQNPAELKHDELQKQIDQAIRRERRRLVEVRSRADSSEVQRQVKLVAPALEWNPRRIKQFMNDFRLQAYIASDLGLLDLVATNEMTAGTAIITLEQLGKFVAITLAWPDLVMDLAGFPAMLTSIYDRAASPLTPLQTVLVQRWSQQAGLADLLFAECGADFHSKFSLARTDLRVLLNITPRVDRNPQGSASSSAVGVGPLGPNGKYLGADQEFVESDGLRPFQSATSPTEGRLVRR
jgi:hypothetical protein